MKHTLKITIILVLVFLAAQVVGLYVVDSYVDHETLVETGNLTYSELPLSIERPEVEESSSFIYIMIAILLGTVLLLLLIRFRQRNLWRIWFLLAVVICLTIAFSAFMNQTLALILAIVLAVPKIFKPNPLLHNITEIFLYGGLAAIFVPIMNLFAAVMLLLLISIYDMYAVWKSKHMVKLAEFQNQSKIFAGLSIPYELPKKSEVKSTTKKSITQKEVKTAILGGGDIGFPLIFAGVVMKGLLTSNIELIFLKIMIIPLITSIALLILLLKSKKDTFYPAMPFLTAGCLVGYGILQLIVLL